MSHIPTIPSTFMGTSSTFKQKPPFLSIPGLASSLFLTLAKLSLYYPVFLVYITFSKIIDPAAPKGPYKLCTVNTAPARAKLLVGRVMEDIKEEHSIDYLANAERIEDVKVMCEEQKPDVLDLSVTWGKSYVLPGKDNSITDYGVGKFCASMWTKEESGEIKRTAKDTVPGIKTMAIPQGLQVQSRPDAVIAYLREKWPELIES